MTTGAAAGLAAAPVALQAQQVVWEDIYGSEGRYHLKMPKGYRYLPVVAHGITVRSYAYMLPDRVVLELIDVVPGFPKDFPAGPALVTALEQSQAGMMRTWPGSKVLEQGQITTGPLTGRDFTLAAADDRFVRVRYYLTRAAIYTQVAQGPMSERGAPMVAEFLDSLQFA
jgi:hypothetical protein